MNAATQIFRRTGSTWVKIEGGLNCVSVGPSGVWGVNVNGLIFYREGTYGDLDTSGTRVRYSLTIATLCTLHDNKLFKTSRSPYCFKTIFDCPNCNPFVESEKAYNS